VNYSTFGLSAQVSRHMAVSLIQTTKLWAPQSSGSNNSRKFNYYKWDCMHSCYILLCRSYHG